MRNEVLSAECWVLSAEKGGGGGAVGRLRHNATRFFQTNPVLCWMGSCQFSKRSQFSSSSGSLSVGLKSAAGIQSPPARTRRVAHFTNITLLCPVVV